MAITFSPLAQYVGGMFGFFSPSTPPDGVKSLEAVKTIDEISQALRDRQRLEAVLLGELPPDAPIFKFAPDFLVQSAWERRLPYASARVFHYPLSAQAVPLSPTAPKALKSLNTWAENLKVPGGVEAYFASLADLLVLGGMEAQGAGDVTDPTESLIRRLLHLQSSENPFSEMNALLEIAGKLEGESSLQRLILETVGLNASPAHPEDRKGLATLFERFVDLSLKYPGPILNDTVGSWIEEYFPLLSKEKRLKILLSLPDRVAMEEKNFNHLCRLAGKMMKFIHPIHLRQFFRSNGKEIAETAGGKLLLWIYHGESGGYEDFACWHPPRKDYTPEEPPLPRPAEWWKSLEAAIRDHAKFKPHKTLRSGRQTFEISKVLSTGERKIAVALVPFDTEEGKFYKMRAFYLSKSQGRWRNTPYVEGRMLVKGADYTSQTQLDDVLANTLFQAGDKDVVRLRSHESDALFNWLDIQSPVTPKGFARLLEMDFAVENFFSSPVRLREISRYPAGSVFAAGDPQKPAPPTPSEIRNFTYPEGFLPDFNRPPAVLEGHHPYLGPHKTYVFEGGALEGHPLEWGFGVAAGRVWIAFIRQKGAKTNSYGAASGRVDAGFLTSKPLEYRTQLGGLDPEYRIPVDGKYDDITPILGELLPIREFIRRADIGIVPVDLSSVGKEDHPIQVPPLIRDEGDLEATIDYRSTEEGKTLSVRYSEDIFLTIERKENETYFRVRGKCGESEYDEVRFADAASLEQAFNRFENLLFLDSPF